LDLQQVIDYGKKHNVGIWLYVNRRALERQLDTLLPLYQSWGIKGIKFGFVQVGSQKVTAWLHEAIMKAAKHQLMVDVHDEYRPTGFSRTYPNLLTQEGIRGDEESPVTEHSIATVFTRMIAGAADNTNCYFNERVDKMGSHVAQMAKSVCLYSPLQFLYWYDKPRAASASGTAGPGEILLVPDLDWYDKLPVTWQESQVLEGDINRFVTIARRNGGNWFIGGLNGHETRRFDIHLKFLKPGIKYVARIYTDDPSLGSATNVKLEEKAVDQSTVLAFDVAPRHGVAIRITPA
jgi:alpha-glucosidase